MREAAKLMIKNKIRHLLVVRDNGAIGIISSTEFANFLKRNVDIDEVNASILKSLLEEKEKELEEGITPN